MADWKRTYMVGQNFKGSALTQGDGSYAQILSQARQLLGFRFGDGSGGIFDNAERGNVWVTSIPAAVD